MRFHHALSFKILLVALSRPNLSGFNRKLSLLLHGERGAGLSFIRSSVVVLDHLESTRIAVYTIELYFVI